MELSKYIKETKTKDGITLRSMEMSNTDIITIAGSFSAGSLYSEKNPTLASLTAEMLDEGTEQNTKQQLAEKIEKLGADIKFTTSPYHTKFKARCKKEHAGRVFKLIIEQLKSPAFPTKQFEKTKKQIISSLEQDKEDTRLRAFNELSRILYKPGHPNYKPSIEQKIDFIKKTKVEDIKQFHKNYYGRGNLKIAIAGATSKKITQELINNLKELPLKSPAAPAVNTGELILSSNKKQKFINIPEKESTDVYFGQNLLINKTHKDYYALFLASAILGYGFMGRLMKNVRNKKGLTYGTAAGLKGFDNMQEGYLVAIGMFPPQLVQTGIEAIEEEIRKLIKQGITQKELEEQKAHIIGNYKLALANTTGITEKILTDLEDGRDMDYIDKLPKKINALTKKQVEDAIKNHLNLNKIVVTAAGSI